MQLSSGSRCQGRPRTSASNWAGVSDNDGVTLAATGQTNRPALRRRAAQAHHGYLFANVPGTRIKLLVHDGFGVWCATRRLHAGRFVWLEGASAHAPAAATLQLTMQQFEALAVGLPWQRLGDFSVISRA